MITSYTAFSDYQLLAQGTLPDVAVAVRYAAPGTRNLVFDNRTGRVVDLDLRGDEDSVRRNNADPHPTSPARISEPKPRGRGRPRLGVVSREVTLLPRHWEWLKSQRGGASSALRRLVETARKDTERGDSTRVAQTATHAFMTGLLGDQLGFEEALRALYALDRAAFIEHSETWPAAPRSYARAMAQGAFDVDHA